MFQLTTVNWLPGQDFLLGNGRLVVYYPTKTTLWNLLTKGQKTIRFQNMQLYTSQKQLNLGHPRNCHLENNDLGTLVCFWQPELLGIHSRHIGYPNWCCLPHTYLIMYVYIYMYIHHMCIHTCRYVVGPSINPIKSCKNFSFSSTCSRSYNGSLSSSSVYTDHCPIALQVGDWVTGVEVNSTRLFGSTKIQQTTLATTKIGASSLSAVVR